MNTELLLALKALESWRLAALAGCRSHGGKAECLRDFNAARAAIIKAELELAHENFLGTHMQDNKKPYLKS